MSLGSEYIYRVLAFIGLPLGFPDAGLDTTWARTCLAFQSTFGGQAALERKFYRCFGKSGYDRPEVRDSPYEMK
jgi:hypothetical protein